MCMIYNYFFDIMTNINPHSKNIIISFLMYVAITDNPLTVNIITNININSLWLIKYQ